MLRKKGKPSKTAVACTFVSYKEGTDFFFFTIKDVDFQRKVILGRVYEDGKWIEKEFPYPDVIYNDNAHDSENLKLYRRLEKEVLFTAHGVGNKTYVYDLLKNDEKMSEYLIPTKPFKDLEQMHEFLDTSGKVVLKPISANQGRGILYVEKNDTYTIVYNKEKKKLDKQGLDQFIEHHINKEYLVQPFIESKTKDGLPFDIRSHLQKNGKGEWVITRIYARIGTKDGIVSNGGYMAIINKFLKAEFGESYKKVNKRLENFSLKFVKHFQSLYKASFDEIGLDLTIDKSGNIYMFEVNGKPSHQSGFFGFDSASNMIPYAKYLVESYSPKTVKIPENDQGNLSIFFGGDTLLGSAGRTTLLEKGYDYPFKDLQMLLNSSDVKTLNLEAPISEKAKKAEKGYKYKMPKEVIGTFKEQGFNIFYLANNHTTDYNHKGLLETVDYLSESNLITLGAGRNEMSARSGLELVKGNEKVGILNYMSYRKSYDERYKHFSYHETSGVAPLEKKKVSQDIAYLRRKGIETIVVSVHWGANYKPITDKQRNEADMIIAAGADVIVGHGSHDYQPFEIRNGIPVFYSLGNFIFTTPGRTDFKYGFPITLSFHNNRLQKAEIWPLYTNNKVIEYQPKHLRGAEANTALMELQSLSELGGYRYDIKDDRAVINFQ
jgi:poly-gamma-glutamate synthesis protein (capsule biosynthesis protein)